MTTHENAAPPAEWTPQPGRHCGEFCIDVACGVCGEFVPVVPPNVLLSDN